VRNLEDLNNYNIRIINSDSCKDFPKDKSKALKLDIIRSKFITRKQWLKVAGSTKLGYLWLVLDPLVLTLVYLFVFTVLRANSEPVSLFIGLSMIRGLQGSLVGGASPPELTGGITIERTRTRAIIFSRVLKVLSDSFFLGIGVSVALIIAFNTSVFASIVFMILLFFSNLFWYSFGTIFSPLTSFIPDLLKLISYFGLIMFFISPALYPLGKTNGIHRQISLYNPFSYFVEAARTIATGSKDYQILSTEVAIFWLIFYITIAYIGFKSLDKVRWRLSIWS
tara:strand:+ start:504 stop:1346 length:843 start_codon:yes stop_codon:yes gene_type:complete